MILLPTTEDFSASSGLIDFGALENIYHSVMDETFVGLGGNRGRAIIHLPPIKTQNLTTQSGPQSQQYNPFFGRSSIPSPTTRNTGVEVTPRDIEFTVHSRIGPHGGDDLQGIGDLKDNEIALTFQIEALQYVEDALSISFEGRRYQVDETRPIGFTVRRYLIVKCTEINEIDNSTGENHG
jgi:hypothetical protein